ncbi:hypothetical protein TKK_0016814 [Trichogramma kaykai]|uniref:Major facilitator superfamily (MFS) profile domain-containing protein n=1 Tax=Trichogramma kaykai TaxID=54128 RepID=A0ABD2W4U7_9HYME
MKFFSKFRDPQTKWIPMRAIMCLMMFTACWTSYVCRTQMPILQTAMINIPKSSKRSIDDFQLRNMSVGNDTFDDLDRLKRDADSGRSILDFVSGKPFDYGAERGKIIRGQLVASYAYGNVVGNFLGGMAAIRFGPRASIFWSSIISVVVSLISPILINIHWSLLLVGRIIIGLTGGMTFPACHALVARWAPPAEKGFFMWSLLGGTFGTIFSYPMIGAIAENLSWEWGWYIPSFLLLIWCFVWWMLAYDSPLEHPGISDDEKTYIVASQAGTVQTTKPSLKETPMKDIFTSVPFIALVICHFGNLFLLYFYTFSLILYMTDSLGMSITKGGFATAAPWALRMVFGFFFCWFGDLNKKKQFLSTTAFRKLATIFSHLIPGLFLIAVGYVGSSMSMIGLVAMLALALGFNGAASISNLSNNQDLSPNYAGFLYGIMNTIGGLSGIIGPPMVEGIVSKENLESEWQIVFWIGAAVCILTMVIFVIFGSGEIQSWNDKRLAGGGEDAKVTSDSSVKADEAKVSTAV